MGTGMDKRYWSLFVLLAWLSFCSTSHAGKVTYIYTDPQGTTLAEADASGNIISTSDYRPYGLQVLGGSEDGPGYTGHVFDSDINMVYMQARYYDPEIGRFVSTDPAGVGITNTFNFGRYVYVNNDPYGHIDPDGRETACVSSGGHCGDFAKGLPVQAIQSGLGAASGALNDLNENVVIPLIGANPAIGEELSVVLRGAADALEAASLSGKTAETSLKIAGDLHAPGDVPDATVRNLE